MRIMVTGADGFVGQYLLSELFAANVANEVIAVTGPSSVRKPPSGQEVANVKWDRMDLTHPESIHAIVQRHRPDAIYHLAGIAVTHGVPMESYVRINALGTYDLAQAVQRLEQPCKLLYVSSGSVYGHAHVKDFYVREDSSLTLEGAYALSKGTAERYLLSMVESGLNVRIVRPFNHTGPGQQLGYVCPDWIKRFQEAAREKHSLMASMDLWNTVRDFTDVRDVVRAYRLIMENVSAGEVVNVCSGKATPIGEIVRTLHHMSGVALQWVQSGEDGASTDPDKMAAESPETTDVLVGDYSKLYRLTGWEPTLRLEDTLEEMWGEGK